MSRIRVVHFHNGTGGGVLSVIRNLLQFSNNEQLENHVIYTINKDLTPEYKPVALKGAVTQQVFYYSPKWNFYFTCRQLAKLLPNEKAVVVAHDWLELGMISNLGLQNPVVQFVHGAYEYYYNLAKLHTAAVDLFIAVAKNIEIQLVHILPNRESDIIYRRFPVPSVTFKKKEKGELIHIIFIGRLEEAKGYSLIPVIAKKIHPIYNGVHWHIVGEGVDTISSTNQWDENITVTFHGNLTNDAVLDLLPSMQIILLPSLAEGMPVVIIEAMKAGVVPVVNELEGGIQELVIDNETGFRIQNNSMEEYVEKIRYLITARDQAKVMSDHCQSLANALFDPVNNTKAIEASIITMVAAERKIKPEIKAYGSRLDEPWIPNSVVKAVR